MTEWDLKQVCLRSAGPVNELSYSFKELKTLGKLVSLTSLLRLNVSFNCLTQLNGIQSLQQLQSLNISHNRLTTYGIEGLSRLRGLTQLICSHNRISSTEALVQLPNLQFLALHSNSINTAGDVLALSSLTKLQHLTLCKNPVCKQENWTHGTIALLPGLQALDSNIISAEQRAAAAAHSDVWAAAGQQEYSCSSTPRDASSSAASECGDAAGATQTGGSGSPAQHGGSSSAGRLSSRTSSGSAGRLRPRVSAPEPDDNISIKDATSMLPSMTLKPLKPSTVVRRPAEAPQPSKYRYSRAKPLKVVQKQTYPASGSPAVLIHSDGSANLTWPEGSMAATLDPEEPPVTGSIASTSSSSAGAPAPIKGCRLLAMYRTITGVAASFDSTGGFVQWPNGQLMLVWNRKDGTAYGPDGRVRHTFNNRRKPPGALQEDITARLDEHLRIRFLAGSHELQLLYSCDGCQAVMSQQHGAVLPDRAVAQEATLQQSGQQQGQQQGPHTLSITSRQGETPKPHSQQQQQAQAREPEQLVDRAEEGSSAAAAAIAGLPDGGEMQALLARARALMAATYLSQSEVAVDEAPTKAPEQAAATVQKVVAVQGVPSQPSLQDQEASAAAGDDGKDDLQAMMARARAAIAATSAALQDLTV